MSASGRISMVLAGAFLVSLTWPPAVEAQFTGTPAAQPQTPTTGGSGGGNLTQLPLPRNNVKSGALSANAPGNWVKAGIANHVDFNTRAFGQFGGATIDPPSAEDASLRQQLLPALVDAFLNALDSLVTTIQAAILVGGTTTMANPA